METVTISICNLCLKTAKLQRSHVLPEFLYLPLYDEKHRAMHVNSDIETKDHYIQKGLREYLFCADCESRLSVYENYAAPIVKSIPGLQADQSGKFLNISNVDYPKFKLFQISLIWRASVAKGPAFDSVSLDEHNDILRRMLYENRPGRPDDYGCMVLTMQHTRNLERILLSPMKKQVNGYPCYVFHTGGIFWYFFLSRDSCPPSCEYFLLTEAGILRIGLPSWSEEAITNPIRDVLIAKDKPESSISDE